MLTFFTALGGFLSVLPQIFGIFTKIGKALDQKELSDFFTDIDLSVDKLAEAKNATTIEERRKLRREALRLGSGAFGRIDN